MQTIFSGGGKLGQYYSPTQTLSVIGNIYKLKDMDSIITHSNFLMGESLPLSYRDFATAYFFEIFKCIYYTQLTFTLLNA